MDSSNKVYTKTGDKGTTALIGGSRVEKDHIRLEAYGTLDELNSFIGLLHDQEEATEYRPQLQRIQNQIFVAESLLASEKKFWEQLPRLRQDDIDFLEKEIDLLDASLEPLRNFILPRGHQIISHCHIARTVCRRSERICYTLSRQFEIDSFILIYLNRLSDYFFVLSRKLASDLNIESNIWSAQ